jgi:hypothetical protein
MAKFRDVKTLRKFAAVQDRDSMTAMLLMQDHLAGVKDSQRSLV